MAVADGKIIASARNAKDALLLGERMAGKVEGIYYVPQKKDLLTALCVFHTCFDDTNRYLGLTKISKPV